MSSQTVAPQDIVDIVPEMKADAGLDSSAALQRLIWVGHQLVQRFGIYEPGAQ